MTCQIKDSANLILNIRTPIIFKTTICLDSSQNELTSYLNVQFFLIRQVFNIHLQRIIIKHKKHNKKQTNKKTKQKKKKRKKQPLNQNQKSPAHRKKQKQKQTNK